MFRNCLSQSGPHGDTIMKTGWAGCMTRHQRMTQSLADLKAVRGAIPYNGNCSGFGITYLPDTVHHCPAVALHSRTAYRTTTWL